MAATDTSINLSLPVTPSLDDPVLFEEVLKIYNSMRTLAAGVDTYTDSGTLSIDFQLFAAIVGAQNVVLQRQIAELREQVDSLILQVNWGQPGEIGSELPATVTATTLKATDTTTATLKATGTSTLADVTVTTLVASGTSTLADTKIAKFGANGKAVSAAIALPAAATDAATTMTLANALRTLLITFGLGS